MTKNNGKKMDKNKKTLDEYFSCCLYFSLSKMQRTINTLAEKALKEIDLAPNYGFLLMILNENDTLSLQEIADFMGISPSTLTRFVDKLEKKQLCSKVQKGRSSTLKITPQGIDMIEKIRSCWGILFNEYNKIYGKEEAKELNDMIVKMNREVR